jgi:uncharacterized membrane protein YhaH (DUF805 family)
MELVRFFFGFSGRVNRTKYWIGIGIVFAISLLGRIALPIWDVPFVLMWLVLIICGAAFLAIVAKRLRDLDRPLWAVLGFALLWVWFWSDGFNILAFAPLVIATIWLGSAHGRVGELPYAPTDFGPGIITLLFYGTASFGGLAVIKVLGQSGLPVVMHVFIDVLVLLLALALGYAGHVVSRRHRQYEQRKRDMRAQKIFEDAQINKAPDFSLFLRAFETTGRMPRKVQYDGWASTGLDPRMEDDKVRDFELVFAQAVEKGLPLVALGGPGEQIGAGRILTSEERWKEAVELLAAAAVVIFLFPSTRPGTLWETDWLIQHGMIKKTIFVMPPFKSGDQAYDWRSIWPELASAMRNKGIEFPSYDDKGLLFSLGNDLRVSVSTKLVAADSRIRIIRDIRRQLMRMADELKSARLRRVNRTHLSSDGVNGRPA